MSKKDNSKALAIIPPSEYAIATMQGGSVAEALAANLGGKAPDEFDLERIKMPSGESKFWEIGGEPVSEITGVIVSHRDGNAYWSKPLEESGGGVPPDCISRDGFKGDGEPGGECDTCPLNQFGSAVQKDGTAGKGKACKNMKVLFVLRAEDILPIVVVLPPTSLGAYRKHMVKMSGKGKKFNQVITRITLETSRKGAQPHAVCVFSKAGDLNEDECAMIEAYTQGMGGTLQRDIDIAQDDITHE